MSPGEVVLRALERSSATASVVLLDDFYDLLELPEVVALRPTAGTLFAPAHTHRVLTAWGNLGFRLAYEPLRADGTAVIIVRKRPDVFLPDVEARLRAPEHRLRITPQWLLQRATGDDEWPTAVDNYFALLPPQWTAWQQAHARFRQRQPRGFTDGDLSDLIVSAWLGVELRSSPDPVTVWQRYFATTDAQEEMQQRFPRLHARWLGWLAKQPPPVSWLADGPPDATVHLLWWVRLLAAHIEDPVALLRPVYPGVRWREGLSAALVERFTATLERHAPKLAHAQMDLAEEALRPVMLRRLLAELGLNQVAGAQELALREQRSPVLLIAALRTIIAHLAQHPDAAQAPEWRTFRARLLERLAPLLPRRNGPALAKHVRLLTALLTLSRAHQQVQTLLRQLQGTPPAHLIRMLVSAYIDAQAYAIVPALENLQALLLDDDINDPRFSPQEDQNAMRQLALRLWEQGRELTRLREELEGAFVRAVAHTYPRWAADPGVPLLSWFWVRHFHPLWQERGRPLTALFFCHGLRWDLWEEVLRPRLEETYTVRTQPLVITLPARPDTILRRWLAGEEWRPSKAPTDLAALAQRSVPERAFTAARWPHPADVEEGLIGHHLTAEGITITEVHLLAPTGQLRSDVAAALTDERAAERLAARFHALLATAPREALIFLVSGGGFATTKRSIAWDPPPGTQYLSPRCAVVPTENVPPEAVGFAAHELLLPPEALLPESLDAGSHPAPTLLLATGDRYFAEMLRESGPSAPPAEGPSAHSQSAIRNPQSAGPCGGGLSLAELVVPCAILLPPPTESGVRVDLSSPVVAEEYVAGQPGELSIVLHLRGGALAEVAVVSCDVPGSAPVTVGLEAGARKPVRVSFVPVLEPGPEPFVELPIQVTVKVAGEEQRRVARIRVKRDA